MLLINILENAENIQFILQCDIAPKPIEITIAVKKDCVFDDESVKMDYFQIVSDSLKDALLGDFDEKMENAREHLVSDFDIKYRVACQTFLKGRI